jgi:hypothetical protein
MGEERGEGGSRDPRDLGPAACHHPLIKALADPARAFALIYGLRPHSHRLRHRGGIQCPGADFVAAKRPIRNAPSGLMKPKPRSHVFFDDPLRHSIHMRDQMHGFLTMGRVIRAADFALEIAGAALARAFRTDSAAATL